MKFCITEISKHWVLLEQTSNPQQSAFYRIALSPSISKRAIRRQLGRDEMGKAGSIPLIREVECGVL